MAKESKFSPTKYKKRVVHPEIRPGVKKCVECGKEFERTEKDSPSNWPYRMYCDTFTEKGHRKCQRIAKARMERARLVKKHGSTQYYKDLARERLREKKLAAPKREAPKHQGHGWFGMVSHKEYGPRTLALEPLPPEAHSDSLGHAFRMAFDKHPEFGDFLDAARTNP